MVGFTEWESFYVIVGSAAGALIGLQFVVMTLIADVVSARVDTRTGAAFATPSVVHFGVVLLLSAAASAPWRGLDAVALLWGVTGLAGVAYVVVVARHLRIQTDYRPVFEDWLFHVLLPFAGYVILAVSAYVVHSQERPAQFLVGGSALLLLFVGIHNAWDAVTYHVFVRRRERQEEEETHRIKGK